MSVSMATEQNGAGIQGAAGLCAAGAGEGWEGLGVLGLLPPQRDGRCPSPSAGAAPGPAPYTRARGPWCACDGQRCPVTLCCAVPRAPCCASKVARRCAFLPPLACLPSSLSLLTQGLSPLSPRQGLPYQACRPGYLIWVSRLPHPEKMCLRIPSAGTALPGVGRCCLAPLCASPSLCPPAHPGTVPPNQHLVLCFLKHQPAAPKDHSNQLYNPLWLHCLSLPPARLQC